MIDERRRHWFKVGVDEVGGPFGTRLQERFGPLGPLVWIAFNAACKRSRLEGQFTYTTIPDAWLQLGFTDLDRVSSEIDLDAFFDYLGRVHETRRKRAGSFNVVTAQRWDEYQTRRRLRVSEPGNPRSAGEDAAAEQRESATDEPVETENDYERYTETQIETGPSSLRSEGRAAHLADVPQSGYLHAIPEPSDEAAERHIDGNQEETREDSWDA